MCNALRSKYGLCSYDGVDAIKYAVFHNFPIFFVTRDFDVILLLFNVCLYRLHVYFVRVYVLCCLSGVTNDNNIGLYP